MNAKWNVAVIGAGKMGSNIVELFLTYDIHIVWIIRNTVKQEEKKQWLQKKIARLEKCGQISHDSAVSKMKNLLITYDYKFLSDVDLVLECCTEDKNAKRELFSAVSAFVKEDTLLLSNTSSISLRTIFGQNELKRSAGVHFFYPVQIKQYVEVNMLPENSSDATAKIKEFLGFVGRRALCLDEKNHFALNRLFLPFFAQACNCIDKYELNVADVDRLVEEKMFSIGPFRFMDSVGAGIIHESVKPCMSDRVQADYFKSIDTKLREICDSPDKEEMLFYRNQVVSGEKIENKEKKHDHEQKLTGALKGMTTVFVNSFFNAVANGVAERNYLLDAADEYIGLTDEIREILRNGPAASNIDNVFDRTDSMNRSLN